MVALIPRRRARRAGRAGRRCARYGLRRRRCPRDHRRSRGGSRPARRRRRRRERPQTRAGGRHRHRPDAGRPPRIVEAMCSRGRRRWDRGARSRPSDEGLHRDGRAVARACPTAHLRRWARPASATSTGKGCARWSGVRRAGQTIVGRSRYAASASATPATATVHDRDRHYTPRESTCRARWQQRRPAGAGNAGDR